jgi:hypothetical protein
LTTGTVPHANVFERHLDLEPLRGRRRGLVKCVFHADRTPSLSIDLDALVFNCHGCGQSGGYKKFSELVREKAPRLGRGEYLSPLDEARRKVLAQERAAEVRRARFRPLMDASDEYRILMREVHQARQVATADPEHNLVEELLTLAARVESAAEAALAEVVA